MVRCFIVVSRFFGMHRRSGFSLTPMPDSAFKSVWHFFFYTVKDMKRSAIVFQCLAIINGLEPVVWMIPFGYFLHVLGRVSDPSKVWDLMLWPAVILVSGNIFMDVIGRLMFFVRSYSVRPNLEYIVSRKMVAMMIDRKLSFFVDSQSSINNRINQLAEGTYDSLISLCESIIPSIIGIFGVIVTLFCFHFYIGIIALLYLLGHFTVVLCCLPKLLRTSAQNAVSHNFLIRNSLNVISNISMIKSYVGEKFELRNLNIFQLRRKRMNQIALLYPEKMKSFLTINGVLIMILGLTFVQVEMFRVGIFNLSDISFVFSSCFSLMREIWCATDDFVKTIEDLGRCKDGIVFFRQSLSQKEYRYTRAKNLVLADSSIVFSDVTFNHSSGKCLFNKQSIAIKNNESVGLVGLSGSGKTTFVNLIIGYFSPTYGKILVGGHDISTVDSMVLRKNITFMQQDANLLDRTVLENIRYGNQSATFDQVVTAAKKAYAHDFIESLPYGYYTKIEDGGSNISGGQRQRIALARAFLKDSKIVILDEATSALDNHTQSVLQKSFDKLMKNRTVIVIAHRLSMVQHVNRILVFRDGEIVEQGTHKKLVSTHGSYYSYLWSLQTSLM